MLTYDCEGRSLGMVETTFISVTFPEFKLHFLTVVLASKLVEC